MTVILSFQIASNKGMFEINKRVYLKITNYFKNNKRAGFCLGLVYKLLPFVVFAAYPIMLVYTLIWQQDLFLQTLLVPAGVFILVTILRKLIGEQRPYEKYGVPSVFGKTTKGQSMPSRHTASAVIIALALLKINFCIGIIALCIALLIALSRILAGVHFIRDISVGAGISILFGVVFIFLI